MRLPQLPYNKQDTQRQILTFGGLNRTDTASEGELIACENLSSLHFPRLAPRSGDTRLLPDVENVTAIYEWDGRLVYVAKVLMTEGDEEVLRSVLYLDGEELGVVNDEEKQFAVVNTKLIVWPDKLYIDLTDNSLGRLDDMVIVSAGGSITSNSFTANPSGKYAESIKLHTFKGNPTAQSESNKFNPGIYCYGKDTAAFELCFGENGWDFSALGVLPGYGAYGFINSEGSVPIHCDGQVEEDMIFIPRKNGNSFDYVWGDLAHGGIPDTSLYNNEGYYGVLTYDDSYYSRTLVQSMWYVNIYKVGTASALLSYSFSVGEYIDISNTQNHACDVSFKRIESIDDTTNTITFEADTFEVPDYRYPLSVGESLTANTQYWLKTGSDTNAKYWYFTPRQTLDEGKVLLLYASAKRIKAVLPDSGMVFAEYGTDWESEPPEDDDPLDALQYSVNATDITITRVVPDLDFICERDNRLWGVSNNVENEIRDPETGEIRRFTSRCIYVSALGLPERFWDFEGLDTDSYQVAVGSEGDFTGIYSYENACLFFKERQIYKLYGNYPSEYYLSEDELPGIQKGSYKSLVQATGNLIYKAPNGIYAYGGSSVSLLSEKLGDLLDYGSAVAGFDGRQYFITMTKDADSEHPSSETLVYDTRTGLWLKRDKAAKDFCIYQSRLVMCSGGKLYYTDADGTETIAWSAEFAPFSERDAHERKHYLRLLLRVKVETGGDCEVWIQRTSGNALAWVKLKTLNSAGEYTVVIPIAPNRIDKLEIRLEGTAPCALLSLAREFKTGSIYGGEYI